jgi:8-oxo-dGTP pyrophosphatase MutT (NUDIX family)
VQVYACVYATNHDFVLATKPVNGYYFSTDGGTVVPAGQKLNGGGNYALPGGRLNRGEAVIDGARREWNEETNSPVNSHPDNQQSWGTSYGAGYFRVSTQEFERVAQRTDRVVIPAAEGAVNEIIQGRITRYAQIHPMFPEAPADNEIETVQIWNLDTDWTRITAWQGHAELGWFYNILEYLRDSILTTPEAVTR